MPSKVPPYNLDPHEAIRNPDGLSILMRRGMYDVIVRTWEEWGISHPKTSPPHRMPTYEEFVRAFNIIAKTLTSSGRLIYGSLKVSGQSGDAREDQVRRLPDTKMKLKWVRIWAEAIKRAEPEKVTVTWWQAHGRTEKNG